MMQIEQRILIVGTPSERVTRLCCILEFLGEQCDIVSNESLAALVELSRYRAVVIVNENIDVDSIKNIIAAAPWQPILLLGDIEIHLSNVLGLIEEPINYPQLTELLHFCQVFGQAKREHTLTNGNQTKLFRSLVGRSEGIANVRHLISQVSSSDATVLVLGQSGTGKEVVARNIHYLSERRDGPFIPVNCGAIPAELLESELFGHEKGSFTGAISARKGRFEMAEGGTLFLDEIGDMPLQMQVKLLRVLQEKVFERVGGSKTIATDVRIVAATHRDLETMIVDNEFREDLFYRLNVFPIEMPALSERRDDVPLLLHELVNRVFNEGRGKVRFTQRAIESLKEHPWSGNVRELSNLIERLTILYPGGLVDVNDLPHKYRYIDVPEYCIEVSEEQLERDALASIFSDEEPVEIPETRFPSELPPEGVNLKDLLAELEIDMIRQALEQQDNVVARAAEMLGIRRTTLVEKMRKYGLSKE
ncbi:MULTISPECIES: sigma-54 dependent transcriptional regulator [Shewanella]|jgi:sigma-54 specific flagellar transcriptional regulator A|uniref:sigma-54 interaction domain-containing protein n=1 Tax=Shewanella TaxID=22 RepID=UPI000C4CFC22|nr:MULTISPECIES: sigma-54 dependent transcriptional regulator [Shewanella]NCQ46282.1 sigma-54-dependent Fis family transcriptional regulator [Shewanella frigidimarina]MBB1390752.1 sigma-54-dependent Fis family transcriptional regulator [Shewanella sp. SG44-6]NCO73114.1 sigma-54-dependent Fis family transcriptional regulator [Shewanella vesiculosa]NCP38566.1 sigma-54-dependent Fis family transcriptional regulator [Shewanella vesiculosa]NCP71140.1 sigma-54-dependent Fis family transcriptional re